MNRLLRVLIFSSGVAARVARGETSTLAGPASSGSPTGDPLGFVSNVFQLALISGALLAFGAIVFGGIKYTLQAGNPSGQGDAKEWITQALFGLLLLLGAYLILNTISPGLTTLNLPRLTPIRNQPVSQGTAPTCGGTTFGTCAVGSCVTDLRNPGQHTCSVGPLGSNVGCMTTGSTVHCCAQSDCSDVPSCRPSTRTSYPQCQRTR